MKKIIIPCRVKQGTLPEYKSGFASGADLRASCEAEIILKPGQRGLIPTGIKIAIPTGCEAQVRPRSGLAVKYGVTVLNTPGTIDADYRGEIKVILINLGDEDFVIHRGDRIAQLVFAPVVQGEFHTDIALDDSERGEGGFGSTGIH